VDAAVFEIVQTGGCFGTTSVPFVSAFLSCFFGSGTEDIWIPRVRWKFVWVKGGCAWGSTRRLQPTTCSESGIFFVEFTNQSFYTDHLRSVSVPSPDFQYTNPRPSSDPIWKLVRLPFSISRPVTPQNTCILVYEVVLLVTTRFYAESFTLFFKPPKPPSVMEIPDGNPDHPWNG
jgi:hypothetical protein